jgi:hypothetical protein
MSEVVYAQSIASKVMGEFFENQPLTSSGEFVKGFLESKMGHKGTEVPDAYITSFCESSDLLSQWRAYGRTAGFEIRFDSLTRPNAFLATEVLALGSPVVDRVKLIRVEYDEPLQKQMLVDILNGTLEVLTTLEEGNSAINIAVAVFATLAATEWLYSIKHETFSEEKEWRIVAFPKPGNAFYGGGDYAHPEEVRFRRGRHSVVPYVELKPTEGRLPFSEVICGPGGHHLLTSKAVQLLMSAWGFEGVKIRNSAVPLAL